MSFLFIIIYFEGSKELLTQVGLNTGCPHCCCPSHWKFAKILADAANERMVANVGGDDVP